MLVDLAVLAASSRSLSVVAAILADLVAGCS